MQKIVSIYINHLSRKISPSVAKLSVLINHPDYANLRWHDIVKLQER
jgi:hypothetical protein